MRNAIIFVAAVLISNISEAQNITFGPAGGYEFAFGKKGGSNRVYNFNQDMLFFQPILLTCWFNKKLGIQAEGQIGLYVRDAKPRHVKLPVPSGNDVLLYHSEDYLSDGQETFKLRIGLVYNIQRRKWAFKPRLLAGLMKLEEVNQTTPTLKEKNTNIYFSDRYMPQGRESGSLKLFLISGGINISRALTPRFSLTADALYSHARNTMPVVRTLTNLYTNQQTEETFREKIRLNSVALGIGFSIKLGQIKKEEDLLRE